ncbi:WD40/YVTN/BNR-like repeat-containing protein [Rhodospira trueperi]|uniref:Exo-alpha-sialidase n=1 Tax=Rhodospira trueperi TaxID=69960 RepID=A0A1G7DVK1_9PROT|nr:hypothetical protein [Rhodospira trueperi]SDE55517.1 hypothetical protein SAMN05421720_10850 [Rhodospira trueperi]
MPVAFLETWIASDRRPCGAVSRCRSSLTRSTLAAIAILAWAGAGVLAAGTVARAAPCEPLPDAFDYAAYDAQIRLDLTRMVSLPPRTVVVTGSYRDAANTVHPALLTSTDGGETWSRVPVRIHGAAIGRLESDAAASVWGIVSFRQEGLGTPLALLRTRDGAGSWCLVSLEGLDTLNGVDLFRMYDDRHGLIVFSEEPFGGGFRAYQTRDGGESWHALWRADGPPPDQIDTAADDPDRAAADPPHATLWRRDSDMLAASAVLRLRRDDGGYAVERYDILGDGVWRLLSRIPPTYRVDDGGLIPIP